MQYKETAQDLPVGKQWDAGQGLTSIGEAMLLRARTVSGDNAMHRGATVKIRIRPNRLQGRVRINGEPVTARHSA